MYKKFIICASFISLLPSSLVGTELSLSQFVTQVLSDHPASKASLHAYIADKQSALAMKGLEDWNLFLSYNQVRGMQAQGSTTFDPDTQSTSAELSLSRLFPSTGTQLAIGSQYTSSVDIPSFSNAFSFDDVYNLDINVQLTQPLLKNGWGTINKSQLQQSATLQQLAGINYQKDLDQFIQVLINDYLAWTQAFQLRKLYLAQVNRAQTQYNLLKRQEKRSAAEPIDLIQAAQNLQSKKILLLQQEQALNTTFTTLQSRLPSLPIDSTPGAISLTVNTPLETAQSYVQSQSLTDQLMDLSYTVQVETVTQKTSAALPDLSLFVSQSLGTAKNSSSTLSDDIGENPILTLGISYTHPLGNTQSNAELAAETAKLDQITHSQLATRRNLNASIANLYAAYEYLSELIKETDKLAKLADQAASLELKTFNQGRSPSYTLVLNAENMALQNRVQLTTLAIQQTQIKTQILAQLDRFNPLFYTPDLREVTK